MSARRLALVFGALGLAAGACVSIPDESRFTAVLGPSFAHFKGDGLTDAQAPVRLFIEKRCGTLDCHGQVGRPFIVYSQRGLRWREDGGNVPGSIATTATEILATYQSIVALEPEAISATVADPRAHPATELTIHQKATGAGRHKGGQVIAPNDPAERCLRSWLEGNAQLEACKEAAEVP